MTLPSPGSSTETSAKTPASLDAGGSPVVPPPALSPALSQGQPPTALHVYRRMGFALLMIALGGFVLWATTAQLAVAVVAPGAVSVESFTKRVQHLEGGIVADILVRDGDQVQHGDLLIRLDDTLARAESRIADTDYLIARASEIRLLAEQTNAAMLTFPDELTAARLQRVREVLAVQQHLFEVRRQALADTLAALDQQVIQLEEQIQGLERTRGITDLRIDSLERDIASHRRLFDDGLISSQRLRELERESLEYQSDNARHAADIARLQAQISELVLNKQVRRQEFQQQVGEDLRRVQAEVADAEERLVALNHRLTRTHIVAPVSGTVVGLDVHTIGAVVRGGDILLELVPSNDRFVVEARVPSQDVDHLHVGQHADIRFSAFNQRLTKVVAGTIGHVSANSFDDETSRQRYYKVIVQVTDPITSVLPEGMTLVAGMPAEVMIRTGERSFASYMLKPLNDMLARAMREE